MHNPYNFCIGATKSFIKVNILTVELERFRDFHDFYIILDSKISEGQIFNSEEKL